MEIREMDIADTFREVGALIREAMTPVSIAYGITPHNYPGFLAYRTDEELRDELIAKDGLLLGAFAKDRLMGAIAMARRGRAREITRLVVERKARHGGCGRKLVLAAEEAARRRGVREIFVSLIDINDPLKEWYRCLGYSHEIIFEMPDVSFAMCSMRKML